MIKQCNFKRDTLTITGNSRFVSEAAPQDRFAPHPEINNEIRRRSFSVKNRVTEIAGSILVIDDDRSLIELMNKFLKLYGVHGHGFTDPRLAVNWYSKHSDETSAIFLDMEMPHMSGTRCFYELKNVNETKDIILMSGGLDKSCAKELLRDGAACFIQKPFDYIEVIDWTLTKLATEVHALPQDSWHGD